MLRSRKNKEPKQQHDAKCLLWRRKGKVEGRVKQGDTEKQGNFTMRYMYTTESFIYMKSKRNRREDLKEEVI